MKRVTISISEELEQQLIAFADLNGYGNRSEACRDLMRFGLEKDRAEAGGSAYFCVATLSHVFNQNARGLEKRLSEAYHAHQKLLVANMRVPLDRDLFLDVVVLRGQVGMVREFAQKIIAERGVTHGKVNFAPANADDDGGEQGARRRRLARSPPKAKRAKSPK